VTETILVAIITGGLSLIGVVITCMATSKKQERAAAIAQAVTDTKLTELTREVREHNNFAVRMPALEQEIHDLDRRVTSLEQYHRGPN
jgi:Flp pilus assembly protein TadB